MLVLVDRNNRRVSPHSADISGRVPIQLLTQTVAHSEVTYNVTILQNKSRYFRLSALLRIRCCNGRFDRDYSDPLASHQPSHNRGHRRRWDLFPISGLALRTLEGGLGLEQPACALFLSRP